MDTAFLAPKDVDEESPSEDVCEQWWALLTMEY